MAGLPQWKRRVEEWKSGYILVPVAHWDGSCFTVVDGSQFLPVNQVVIGVEYLAWEPETAESGRKDSPAHTQHPADMTKQALDWIGHSLGWAVLSC